MPCTGIVQDIGIYRRSLLSWSTMKSLLCILVSILSGCSVTVVTCRCSFVCVDRVMTLSEGGHFVAVLRGTYAYPGVGTDVSWMWEWLLQSLGTWTLWRWLWLHRAQRTATEAMLGRLSHPGSVGQRHVTGWHNAELLDSSIWSSVHRCITVIIGCLYVCPLAYHDVMLFWS